MPIGLLKVLCVAKLPGDLMPALPAGSMDDQVRHLQARFHRALRHKAAFYLDTMTPQIFQVHASQVVIALHEAIASVRTLENQRHHVYVALQNEAGEIVHRN